MDELLQAIRDNPDDDAPRLVWADRVGGERGELVVLQCAIAAKRGTRAERVQMQARVRELSAGKRYRRGFVERASIGVRVLGPELFAENPMLCELQVTGFAACNREEDMPRVFREVVVPGLGVALGSLPVGLRALDLHLGTSHYDDRGEREYAEQAALVDVIAASQHAPTLRALRLDLGMLEALPAPLPLLEELLVNVADLTHVGALLRAHPKLTRFGARFTDCDLAPLIADAQHLHGLDLHGAARFDPDAFAATRFAYLGLGHIDMSPNTGAAFATMASLRSLDLRQHRRRPPVRLPANDAIECLQLTRVDDETIARLLALPRLEEVTVSADATVVEALRRVIPRVNDG